MWNLSKIGPEVPEKKLFEILNIFPIQMHKEAEVTVKRSNVNVQPLF